MIAVYFNDIPVGTACSRIERGNHDGEAKLYMMTMGVLAVCRLRRTTFGAGHPSPAPLLRQF
jgi:hypothetical protein